MDSQQQRTHDPSDGPKYFRGLFPQPPDWRLWPQAGPRFWAGVIFGVGVGLVVAAILVDLELVALNRELWAIIPGMFVMLLGRERLRVVVRRQAKGGQGQTGQS